MLYLSSTYKVSYKENPLKAIAWLQEGNLPDLIISDLNMPEMSGEEFLVYLKANDMFSHIPVLILSSVESSSNRIRLFGGRGGRLYLEAFQSGGIKGKGKTNIKIMNYVFFGNNVPLAERLRKALGTRGS